MGDIKQYCTEGGFENAVKSVGNIKRNPTKLLNAKKKVRQKLRVALKSLYEFGKTDYQTAQGACILEELYVEGFDPEQIWQQLMLETPTLLNGMEAELDVLEKKPELYIIKPDTPDPSDSNESDDDADDDDSADGGDDDADDDDEGDGDGDDDEEEDAESSALDKNRNSDKRRRTRDRSEVDDQHFSLASMEAFTQQMEEEYMKGSEEEEEGDQDEDEDFANMERKLQSKSGSDWRDALFEGGGDDAAAKMMYSDMFDPPAEEVSGDEDDGNDGGGDDEDGDDDNGDGDDDSDNDAAEGDGNDEDAEAEEAAPTFFQKKQQKIQKQIKQLEAEAVAEKDWALKGEIEAGSRPHNALLDVHLEYDTASKAIPVITEEVTESIEDIIRRRILNDEWDDVERKEEVEAKPVRQVEVSTEKSKKSLGELYEAEYLKKMYGDDEDAEAEKKAETTALFDMLCDRLDALSNFNFKPKMASKELAVKPNTASITMEEVIPLAVSAAQMQAPEEVYEKKTGRAGVFLSEGEKSRSDRKRIRNAKKSSRRKRLKRAGLGGGKGHAKAQAKRGKDEQTDNSTTVNYSSSAAFFNKLTDTVTGEIEAIAKRKGEGQKKKGKRGGKASALKL